MLDHLQLLLLAIPDGSLQFLETITQPVHREVVHCQCARLQFAGNILDERLIELEEQRCCGRGSGNITNQLDCISTKYQRGVSHLYFSVNSPYSSVGLMLPITVSMRFWISLYLSAVRSPYWAASCRMLRHSRMKLS